MVGRHCGLRGARGQVRLGGLWVLSGLQTSRWTQWEQRWLKRLGPRGRSLCLGEKTDKGQGPDTAREMDAGRSHRCTLATKPVGLRQQHLQNSVTESFCIRGLVRDK